MEHINPYVLLAFSLVITLTYSILRNYFSKKQVKTVTDYHAFNALSSILSAIVLILLALGKIKIPSAYTLLLGIAFGILTALAALFCLQALNLGPMSYTTVITTSSMIIPALSGLFFWGETISLWQYGGILLMVISTIFAVDKKSDNKKSSSKWLILCLLTLLFSGLIGVMQKVHQSSSHRSELSEFLIIAFLVSALFSLFLLFWYQKVKKIPKSLSFSIKSPALIMGVVSGICIAFANQINLYLSGVMPSIIFFPIVNGGGLLLSVLVAVFFFREKLAKKQWVGILIGMVSVLLLCNIF